MKRENIWLTILIIILFVSLVLAIGPFGVTGFVTSGSTVSNVTITNFLSISMSENLQSGILFGSVSSLPAVGINASHNYDGGSDATSMSIAVSSDSNTNVDFCIKANTDMTDAGLDIIGIGNETYSNATVSTDATSPPPAGAIKLTTSNVKSGENIERGSSNYYRVWLGIPAAQAPGTYNNSVLFEGVATGGSCS